MANINLPFAASGSRRAPNSGELSDGYPCGPLDEELDNWLEWYTTGQIAEVIRGAGMTPDDADLTQLLKALRRVAPSGAVRLVLDGSNLRLNRFNGNQIVVNGEGVTIPVAGVALSAAGAANNTLYSIYLYMDGTTPTLERSTTGRATHTDGTQIKTGDATRAFVGFARTNASGAWEDSPSKRFVRSYFNRKAVPLWNRFTTNRSTSALEGSKVELSTEIRCEFVCFSDDSIAATSAGYFTNSGSNFSYCAVTFDGTSTDTGTISAAYGSSGSVMNAARNAGPGLNPLADGYHYATLTGYVSGGDSNTPTCAIHAMLH